jgi:DNA-binding MarR family transcriptional regulator
MTSKGTPWSLSLPTLMADWYVKHPNAQPTVEELGKILNRPPSYVRRILCQLVREGFLQRRISYVLTKEDHARSDDKS